MAEKRQHNRLDILGHVQVRKNPFGPPIVGLIGDVSHSGMRIHVKEPLSGQIEISGFCFVDVACGIETEIAERVKGKVSWIKQKGKWYSVGIRFNGLSQKNHSAILAFLDKYIKIK